MSRFHDKVKNNPLYKAMREEVLERDGYACIKCGDTLNVHVDHIVPLALGGEPFSPENAQVLCRTHNLQKGSKIDIEPRRNTWINPKFAALSWLTERPPAST